VKGKNGTYSTEFTRWNAGFIGGHLDRVCHHLHTKAKEQVISQKGCSPAPIANKINP